MSITESYIEIMNLLYSYADRIDAGDFAGVGELFAHGAIVFETPDGRVAGEIRGAEAVQRQFERSTRRYDDDGTPHSRHVITNPIVDIDDDAGTATVRYYITVFQRTDTFPLQPVWANRYEDELRRIDGTWRITRRRGFAHLPGDVSQHLLPGALG